MDSFTRSTCSKSKEWALGGGRERTRKDNTKAQQSRWRKAGSSYRHYDTTAWEGANECALNAAQVSRQTGRLSKASGRWQRTEGNAELNEGALVGTGGVHKEERELTGRSLGQRRMRYQAELA